MPDGMMSRPPAAESLAHTRETLQELDLEQSLVKLRDACTALDILIEHLLSPSNGLRNGEELTFRFSDEDLSALASSSIEAKNVSRQVFDQYCISLEAGRLPPAGNGDRSAQRAVPLAPPPGAEEKITRREARPAAALQALRDMEPHVYDIGRVASILMHIGGSPSVVTSGEINWIGEQLHDHSKPLLELYEKAWQLSGGSTLADR